MVKIKANNVYCYCDGPAEELAQINDLLSYNVKGAYYTKAFKSGAWKGKASLFHTTWKTFPAGLLKYVIDKLVSEIEFQVISSTPECPNREFQFKKINSEFISLYDKNGDILQLRDYQIDSIKSFLNNIRGIIKVPTRGGKSVIGIACTKLVNTETLFIVHTKDLLDQTIDEYKEKLQIDNIGQIGDSVYDPKRITVAIIKSLDSLYNNESKKREILEFFHSIKLLIFDEVHRASSQYQTISKLCKNANWRLGLSATALIGRKDTKLRSMAITGPLIYEVKTKKLLDRGHIAKPIVTFIQLDDNLSDIYGDWNTIYTKGIVEHDIRNIITTVIVKRMIKKSISSLVLVERKEHGESLEDFMRNHLINVKYVSGSDNSNIRKDVKHDLNIGNLDAVISTRIFNEGINIVTLQNVIVASGYKSPILSIQQKGRGITKTSDKVKTYIWDFIDTCNETLYNHSMKRYKTIKKDKAFDVKIITVEEFLKGE